ncbi:hypothetical protein LSTR_LSTR014081 [Laodelphax striatellus]|uniref:Uncharacterized protein n=1 Tax=Laodelphax striatellus TaxID=195883 RepID=A0A482X7P8_LAOST|nr:hypothetical protein LSTR_LSTR014081 [Laodelphax striatellus]
MGILIFCYSNSIGNNHKFKAEENVEFLHLNVKAAIRDQSCAISQTETEVGHLTRPQQRAAPSSPRRHPHGTTTIPPPTTQRTDRMKGETGERNRNARRKEVCLRLPLDYRTETFDNCIKDRCHPSLPSRNPPTKLYIFIHSKVCEKGSRSIAHCTANFITNITKQSDRNRVEKLDASRTEFSVNEEGERSRPRLRNANEMLEALASKQLQQQSDDGTRGRRRKRRRREKVCNKGRGLRSKEKSGASYYEARYNEIITRIQSSEYSSSGSNRGRKRKIALHFALEKERERFRAYEQDWSEISKSARDSVEEGGGGGEEQLFRRMWFGKRRRKFRGSYLRRSEWMGVDRPSTPTP